MEPVAVFDAQRLRGALEALAALADAPLIQAEILRQESCLRTLREPVADAGAILAELRAAAQANAFGQVSGPE